MNYRTLAGERVSQLGFGAMRLPLKDKVVDVPQAKAMIRRAIDAGINYVDTAWVYHGGESEGIVGQALSDGYRQKTMIATKSPLWLMEKKSDFDKFLNQQLERLKTDHIDFYLLHSFGKNTWKTCLELDALEFLRKAKAAGKIGHFGFSFHDELPLFKEIVDTWPWEFCQIQYNYLDREFQAGEEGLEYAAAKGLDVVIMEPLRGGNLALNVPPSVQRIWDRTGRKFSPAEWALRWVWNRPEVSLVLSGMSSPAQLEENLVIAGKASTRGLSPADLNAVDAAAKEYRRLVRINCTACAYCMPCPSGVDIPRNFAVYNEAFMFGNTALSRGGYAWVPAEQKADKCVECGACLPLCPQGIEIPTRLAEVRREFA